MSNFRGAVHAAGLAANPFGQALVHQRKADFIVWRIQQVLKRLDFTEDMQCAGEKVDGNAHVAFLHAAHGGQGGTHALGQRSLGDVAAPASQGNVAAEFPDGAFNGYGGC